MQQPLVSVIVPVYNVEKYIDRTMNSLLNQTLKDIEIILVDDESPDNCPKICDGYADKYKNVKVIHKKNAGLGMACNSGIEIATGEYIAFCDSDDYVDEDMYEAMYNTAIQHNADAVFSGIKTVDDYGKVSIMNQYPSFNVINKKSELDKFAMDMIASEPSDPIERHIAMSAKTVLYKKEIIDNNNLRFVSERELTSEDLIWNIDFILKSKCIVNIPNVFYYYYINNNSLTKIVRTDRFELYKILRNGLFERYINYNLPNIKDRIDKMFIGYSRYYIGTISNSKLCKKEKLNIIKKISNDNIWNEIKEYYQENKTPLIHRLIFLMIKNNHYKLLYFFYKSIYIIKK